MSDEMKPDEPESAVVIDATTCIWCGGYLPEAWPGSDVRRCSSCGASIKDPPS